MVHAVTGLVSPIVKAASAAGIAFKDSTGTTQATIDSSGLTATTSVVPAADNTAVLGTPSLQWLAGYISVLNTGVVHAVGASGIGFKDSTGTVQATIDSNGLDVDTLTASSGRIASVEVNAQTGTTYTLVLGDAGKVVTMSNASANTLTIPTNASVAYDVGTVINVMMIGAGTTTIAGDTGVTVNGTSAGSVDVSAQYQGVALLKIATDSWAVSGAIA
jgi:hypothetical protein